MQVLARDKPRLYSAACGGFPCKHLIAVFAKNILKIVVYSQASDFSEHLGIMNILTITIF
jgi:hypothetical protein